MNFRYQEIAPQPALAPYINCFWLMEETNSSVVADRSVPDGCVELVFHRQNRVERTSVGGQPQLNPVVELIGQQIRAYTVRLLGHNQVLGVRFFPHTFAYFSPIPLLCLTSQVLDAGQVLGVPFRELARRVLETERIDTAIELLEAYFVRQLTNQQSYAKQQVANFAVQWMLRRDELSDLNELTRQTSVTNRYLQQIFEERVGVSPKLLLRIIRFQRTFQHLARPENSLTDVAYAGGYYDQSHFIRDFKTFAGVPPSVYRREPAPINTFCLAESSTSYLYNFR